MTERATVTTRRQDQPPQIERNGSRTADGDELTETRRSRGFTWGIIALLSEN